VESPSHKPAQETRCEIEVSNVNICRFNPPNFMNLRSNYTQSMYLQYNIFMGHTCQIVAMSNGIHV
jgi:hypothetical protein